MDTNNNFNLGRHEALIEQLVSGQTDIVSRLGDIEKTIADQAGERRATRWAMTTAGGFVGATLAFVAHFLPSWGSTR
jgi:hypothetical protein